MSEQIALTPGQRRFADEHSATSCVNTVADVYVCVYRERADSTMRWIIDRHGDPVETTEFEHSLKRRPRRSVLDRR